MDDEFVRATDELGKVISSWPPKEHDRVLHIVADRTEELMNYYKHCTPAQFVQAFYEVFDELLEEVKVRDSNPVSCKRGCHFCCRQNVTIWDAEAQLIAHYCKKHGIDIPKDYLEEQLKYGYLEVAQQACGWCTFLKGGECSIYPVRPLKCRKYFVASPAEFCDTVKYPSSKGYRVGVAVYTWPEVEASAFASVMEAHGHFGRLPEMMLPYSK